MSSVIHANFGSKKSTVMYKVGSRSKNDDARGRRYMTDDEIQDTLKIINKRSRNKTRDTTMVLAAYRHGLRISELCELKWQHINLKNMTIQIKRKKGSISNTQPIVCAHLLRSLRKLHKEQGSRTHGFMFLSEGRDTPMTAGAFRMMFGKMTKEATGQLWNPHALRHATCVTQLNRGLDLREIQLLAGHANIQNTVGYLSESTKPLEKVTW